MHDDLARRVADALDAPQSRQAILRKALAAGLGLTAGGVLAACGSSSSSSSSSSAAAPATSAAGSTAAASGGMDALISAAKGEGELNVIALPPDWANYAEIIKTFGDKYGIKVNSTQPDISSADEITAVKTLKGRKNAPDAVDVSPAFAVQGAQANLFQPYKVATWATVPDSFKDPTGLWTGDYYGVIAFGANTDATGGKVPGDWADLKDPAYKGKVALNGDPRKAGAAFAGVFAAALGNGGSFDDISPGIDFFAELKKSGNFVPVEATPATVESGQTPVTIDWDYLQIGYTKEFASKLTWKVGIPKTGKYGSFYAQAIPADAPHPNAAKLWQEFLYSDEGQLLWLKGYSHPVRFDDLTKTGKIPANLLSALPAADNYADVKFATQDQIDKAKEIVTKDWGPKVAGA
jgi:putative spermidine/putrescine transport system substrate-binding protein